MGWDFLKAHGLGNDFVLHWEPEPPARLPSTAFVRRLCRRQTGVGADGLILVWPESDGRFHMELFNSDGSMAEISGNGLRCVVAALSSWWGVGGREVLVHTGAGPRRGLLLAAGPGGAAEVRVTMGSPGASTRVEFAEGVGWALSMGNPHLVLPVDTLPNERHMAGTVDSLLGHPAFPQGVNVSWMKVHDPGRIELVIWERGVGPTAACGSGASAAATVAHRLGLTGSEVDVVMPGGVARVVTGQDEVLLTGPAHLVYRGALPDPA